MNYRDRDKIYIEDKLKYNFVKFSYFITFVIIFFFSTEPSITAPLYFVPITLTQPDGKIINCFASGDEFYNWVHDKNNYTITKNNKTGYYVYALLSGEELIPSDFIVGECNPSSLGLEEGINIPEKKMTEIRKSILSRQTYLNENEYNSKMLAGLNNIVIFIRFSNENEFGGSIKTYDSIFNHPTAPSVYNYFNDVSYKQISINSTFYPASTNTVVSYQDSHPREYFQPYDSLKNSIGYKGSSTSDPKGPEGSAREKQLIIDAVESIKAQIPPELQVDMNNDGYVDNICFIVSGTTTAWATLLWPHKTSLSSTIYINNKKIRYYNFLVKSMTSVTVLSHEMMHTLGAPDLYHYNNLKNISPCSMWDLMDGGSAHVCSYLKYKYLKWITDIPEISTPGKYSLSPVGTSKNCAYKIKSALSNDEFYIVEYRKRDGNYERLLPGDGLLVYRINKKYSGNASGPPDEVYLYRPNGTPGANGSPNIAFFNKNAGRFLLNPNTNPTCFLTDGSQGDLNITVESPINLNSPNSTISFTLEKSENISGEYTVSNTNFSWVDISKTGTEIVKWKNGSLDSIASLDDGWTPNPIPLGFEFSFYNQKFTNIYAGINGLVSFTQKVLNTAAASGSSAENIKGLFDQTIKWPGNTFFPNSIAIAYTDLTLNRSDLYGGGRILYKTQNNKFIITWENVGSWQLIKDTSNTFQMILNKLTGEITIQIKKFSTQLINQNLKIGIQKNEKDGLSWVDSGDPGSNVPTSNYAVIFTPKQVNSISTINNIPAFALSQNYPNPFNPSTNIRYSLSASGNVSLKIYDLLGREIKTLVDHYQNYGSYLLSFDGKDFCSGIYYLTLKISSPSNYSFTVTKKMMLIK